MKILSMSATFGKLEHETLTLEPGLNILEAPNEWGKSTWCAFITAMFYGMDTRAKSTKASLAEKERYAPWSGTPMEGRMELEWNGKYITLERQTKGRIPMGVFRAYETGTGLEIPELNAANCGQLLLGVERSVFLRSAFVRFSDLPVTQDEALRQRLNALVTTGDESGSGERLAKALKELKNRCRYRQTGLLPQAEASRNTVENTLREQEELLRKASRLEEQLRELSKQLALLENHRDALRYAEACADAERVRHARALHARAAAREQEAAYACQGLPDQDGLQQRLNALRRLSAQWTSLQAELSAPVLPPEEALPPFRGKADTEALAAAREDAARYAALSKKRPLLPILGAAAAAAGAALCFFELLPGIIAACVGIGLLTAAAVLSVHREKERKALIAQYGGASADTWLSLAARYVKTLEQTEAVQMRRVELTQQAQAIQPEIQKYTQGASLRETLEQLEDALAAWNSAQEARRELDQAERHLETLTAMARTAPPPAFEDTLTLSAEETRQRLDSILSRRQQLTALLGQYQGRTEAMGDPEQLRQTLNALNRRIRQLEEYDAALTLAQETLAQATAELQRRFAPRITQRAAQLMSRMTDGRYDRLRLSEDLALYAGTGSEGTLRAALWRSEGTVDQLYLSLRLAVAEALTPDAPLVLDDALVRFDDRRLSRALEILREEAENRQILLFTCQSREMSLLKKNR